MNSRTLLLAACATASCDVCLPERHVVRGMRVLGTVLDPPVATPGGAVTLRAVTIDVEARDVQVAWYRCPGTLLDIEAVGEVQSGVQGFARPDLAVARCLRSGPAAQGVSVRVPIDGAGGQLDAIPGVRVERRWTDFIGFACAGTILPPASSDSPWPRCTTAPGVVFTASIPGPTPDSTADVPAPLVIEETMVSVGGVTRPLREDARVEVAGCEGSRDDCAPAVVCFSVRGVALIRDPTSASEMSYGLGVSGARDTAFVAYHVSDQATSSDASSCLVDDPGARIETEAPRRGCFTWYPPSRSGEVTFWITARRQEGAFTVARRVIQVL